MKSKILSRITAVFSSAIFLLSSAVAIRPYAEQEKNDETETSVSKINSEYKPIDIIILLDASGSMAEADPQNISRDAAKTLISNLPNDDTRVAVYSFYSHVQDENNTFYSTDTAENRLKLFECIDNTEPKTENKKTALLDSISFAVDKLNDFSDNDHKKAILVLTDGEDTSYREQLSDAANKDEFIKSFTDKTKELDDLHIFSLGFNHIDMSTGEYSLRDYNGNAKTGLDVLEAYSSAADGMVSEATDTAGISEFFNKVIQKLLQINQIPITVKDHEALINVGMLMKEVNIAIDCDTSAIEQTGILSLTSPDGETVSLFNESRDNIIFDKFQSNINIKLLRPSRGVWKLTFDSSISDSDLSIRLIPIYKIEQSIETVFSDGVSTYLNAKPKAQFQVKCWLSSENEVIESQEVYDSIEESSAFLINSEKSLNITEQDDILSYLKSCDVIQQADMIYDENENAFVLPDGLTMELPDECNKKYLLCVWVKSNDFYCYTDHIIEIPNNPPQIETPTTNYNIKEGETLTDDKFFETLHDEENDDITIKASSKDDNIAEVNVSDNKLIIKAKKAGSTELLVTVSDEYGSTEYPVKVNVGISNKMLMIYIGGGVLAAALLIFIIVKIINSRKKYVGTIMFESISAPGEMSEDIFDISDSGKTDLENYALQMNIKMLNMKTLLRRALMNTSNISNAYINELDSEGTGSEIGKALSSIKIKKALQHGENCKLIITGKNRIISVSGIGQGKYGNAVKIEKTLGKDQAFNITIRIAIVEGDEKEIKNDSNCIEINAIFENGSGSNDMNNNEFFYEPETGSNNFDFDF